MSGADLVRELGERRRVFTSEATISRIKNGKPHKAAPAVIVAIKAITGLKRL